MTSQNTNNPTFILTFKTIVYNIITHDKLKVTKNVFGGIESGFLFIYLPSVAKTFFEVGWWVCGFVGLCVGGLVCLWVCGLVGLWVGWWIDWWVGGLIGGLTGGLVG